MSYLSALIIDDERRGRELLQQLLIIHCPEISTINTASSFDAALDHLRTHRPHLLFLDIRLGNDFGLDLIPFLPQPAPAIIVTTAHQDYAIKAIKASVTDYLLKPIIGDELKAAVTKAADQLLQQADALNKTVINNTLAAPPKKITVPTADGFRFINTNDLLYCKAEGAYTQLFLKANLSVLVSSNLGELEKLLTEEHGFFRVHHTWLINIQETEKFIKSEGGHLIMSDQKEIPVSQRKKALFMDFIKRFS